MNEGEFRNDASEKDKLSSIVTVDEILKTKGNKHLTKKEAKEHIRGMFRFCMTAYLAFSKSESNKKDEVKTNKNKAA
tara:strand:- start:67257 stop:67487 length:231 start_codon:yes stop_codon:yes gene_type:complete